MGRTAEPGPGLTTAMVSDRTDKPAEHQEPRPAHWGFWGTLIWSVLLAVVFITLQTVTVTVVLLAQERHPAGEEFQRAFVTAMSNGNILSLVTFTTTIVCTGLLAGIIKLKRRTVLKEYLCLRKVPYGTVLGWLGMLAVFIAATNMLTLALGRPLVTEFMSGVYASADPLWMLLAALLIAAPLFEETFFRGFLYQGLASAFPGPAGAVLITAALWALVHTQYDVYNMVIIFGLGLLFGAARARTGSLLVPLVLHAATNLEATLEAAFWG